MAEKINAKYMIGVHSSHPERLVVKNSRQIFPKKGEVLQLVDGRLREVFR